MTIHDELIYDTYPVNSGNETGIVKALFVKPSGRVVAILSGGQDMVFCGTWLS